MQKALFIRPEILTHPNIPKPLHGLNPRTIKGDTWWKEVRKKAYAENNFCCWACGIPKHRARFRNRLEAHEYYEIDYAKGSAEVIEVVALCIPCHHFIHSGRQISLFQKGDIIASKLFYVMRHGMAILMKANLQMHSTQADAILHLNTTGIIRLNEEEWSYIYECASIAPIKIAPWEKWHLILEGEKHYSKFMNFDEWNKFYANQ